MEAEELAALLVGQETWEAIEVVLERYRSNLDDSVIYALGRIAERNQVVDARQTRRMANIVQAIADRLKTGSAAGLSAWFQAAAAMGDLEYDEAIVQLEVAERFLAGIVPKMQLIGMSVNRVSLLKQTGQYESAISQGKEVIGECARLGDPANLYVANLRRSIGQAYYHVGDYDSALEELNHSESIYAEADDRTNVALLAMSKTLVLEALGQLEDIEEELHRSLKILNEIEATKEVGRVQFRLGEFAYRTGQYEQALKHLERARNVFVEQEIHREVASIDLVRSSIFLRLGFLKEAIYLASESETELLSSNLPFFAGLAARNQALGHLSMKRFEEANDCNVRSRALFDKIGARAQSTYSDLLDLRIKMHHSTHDSTAQALIDLLTNKDVANLPALHVRALLCRAEVALQQETVDPQEVLALTKRLGRLAKQQHLIEEMVAAISIKAQASEAAGDFLMARRFHLKAIEELLRVQSLVQTELLQSGYSRSQEDILKRAIEFVHCSAECGAETLDELIMLMAVSRGFQRRGQQPLNLGCQKDELSSATNSLINQLVNLRKKWHWHYQTLDNPVRFSDVSGEAVVDHQKIRDRMRDLESRILDSQLRLSALNSGIEGRNSPKSNSLLPMNPSEISMDLQMTLDVTDALLVFYEADNRLHCIIVTAERIHLVKDLAGWFELVTLLRKWKFLVREFPIRGMTSGIDRTCTMLLDAVGRHLSGVFELISKGNSTRLYVSLPAELSELPLSALKIDGKHLIESCEISYLTSLGSIDKSNSLFLNDKRTAILLGFADDDILQYTAREFTEISDLLEGAQWEIVRSCDTMDLLAARNSILQDASLIHVAGHGQHRTDNPFFSLLQIGESGLAAADVYFMSFRQEPLVFLNACETGKMDAIGTRSVGLSRAFIQAGAQGAIASLWPVIDEFASIFAKCFYRHFIKLDGNGSKALKDAQCEFLNDHAPLSWANYVYRV